MYAFKLEWVLRFERFGVPFKMQDGLSKSRDLLESVLSTTIATLWLDGRKLILPIDAATLPSTCSLFLFWLE